MNSLTIDKTVLTSKYITYDQFNYRYGKFRIDDVNDLTSNKLRSLIKSTDGSKKASDFKCKMEILLFSIKERSADGYFGRIDQFCVFRRRKSIKF